MKVLLETGERIDVVVPGRAGAGASVAVRTTHADAPVCEVVIENGHVVEVHVVTPTGERRRVYDTED